MGLAIADVGILSQQLFADPADELASFVRHLHESPTHRQHQTVVAEMCNQRCGNGHCMCHEYVHAEAGALVFRMDAPLSSRGHQRL